MYSLLIADGGSSKTDWCLLSPDGTSQQCQTRGLNPFVLSQAECREVLNKEMFLHPDGANLKIVFYGAGLKDKSKTDFMKTVLQAHFGATDVEAHSDLLAAARATCGREKGIVCILGTGSNSGYFNGEAIELQNPSLGYVLGDEGSGTHLGKKVLQYYFYNSFDEELKAAFENNYGRDLAKILDGIYKQPMANRYLASFTNFLSENKHHFMVSDIVEEAFIDFHQKHLFKYRESWKYPIHFVGSVAWEFKEALADLHHQFGIETGKILKSPIAGLIDYHKRQLSRVNGQS